jgi:hypothetical protein
MPRRKPRVRPVWPIVLSLSEISVATHIPIRTVRDWVRGPNPLPVYGARNGRKLVFVADLVEYLKTSLQRLN